MIRTKIVTLFLSMAMLASSLTALGQDRFLRDPLMDIDVVALGSMGSVVIEDKMIVLFEHDGVISYLTFPVLRGKSASASDLAQHYIPLKHPNHGLELMVNYNEDRTISEIMIWDGVAWNLVEKAPSEIMDEIQSIKEPRSNKTNARRPLPPFSVVPMAPPPNGGGGYAGSAWRRQPGGFLCLIDYFEVEGGLVGSVACCEIGGPTIPTCP